MKAFTGMPEVEIPSEVKGEKGRIFELRRYENHSRMKNVLKVEMFNDGGEIKIFRDVGLHPVFFGQTVAGPLMPNVLYMLAFKDMAERDTNWSNFGSNPDWDKLKVNPRYKDTVSAITDVILSPAPCSQI